MVALGARVGPDETGRIVERSFAAEPLRVLGARICEDLADFLVAAASRSVPMAIVSDYQAAGKLAGPGISQYFKTIVIPGLTGMLRPAPTPLLKALELPGVAREDALCIGDRLEVEGLAAQRVGIRCAIRGAEPGTVAAGYFGFRSDSRLLAVLDPRLAHRTGVTIH